MTQPPDPEFVPVILAGGSGTRFWPRSRRARAKQVLALSGEETMIQQTCERLLPLATGGQFMVITNDLLAATIEQQLPQVQSGRILREPAARNTAPACALAAMLVARTNPDAVLGIFPSDHMVTDDALFVRRMREGIRIATAGDNIVVLGAPPTRPETGYGYIQEGAAAHLPGLDDIRMNAVQCFTEKPDLPRAEKFLGAGNFKWNSGIFLWSAKTLIAAFKQCCPGMVEPLQRIAASFGTPEFEATFAELYPTVENISIDYAILEPRSTAGEGASRIYCIPADFGWNDLGSWSALHEYCLEQLGTPNGQLIVSDGGFGSDQGNGNVVEALSTVQLDASGNYVYAPTLTVALLGVQDLVVVQTEDALLVTTRAHSQQVGRVVAELVKHSRHELV